MTITPEAGAYPITPYVVGPVGKAGYQTVQSAVNAANTAGGGLVYLQEGTYTENLTLYPNVNIQGAVDSAVLIGVHTPPTTGTTTFDSLILISATDIFNSSAAGSTVMNVNNCFVLITNGYIYNLPNWTGELLMDNCGEASTNDGVINNSGGSPIKLINVEIGAGSGKTMNVSSSQFIRFDTCNVNCPVNVSGSGQFIVQNGVRFGNTLTIGGSLSGYIIQADFITGANPSLIHNTSGAITISGVSFNSTAVPVIQGTGTGLLTLTDVGFVQSSSIIGGLNLSGATGFYPSQGTNGQVFLGATNQAGKFGTLTSSDNSITFTTGANALGLTVTGGTSVGKTITGDSGGALSPTAGNWNLLGSGSITTSGSGSTLTTQLTGLTNHAVLVGAGTTTMTKLAVGSNGQVLIGATGADPAFATITSTGGTIAFTLGANTLNMEVVGGGIPWTDITSATQTLAIKNGYVTNRGGGVTYTLPATATEGDIIRVAGKSGAWTIAQNANQQINVGSSSSTVGVGGSIASTNAGDCVELLCTTGGASTIWRVISSMGNITVV